MMDNPRHDLIKRLLNPAVTGRVAAAYEPRLRASTFPLTKLHPGRVRRITFVKEGRKLIGFLAARGDAETPYTVRMQPWGSVTGRFVGADGKPLKVSLGQA